MKINVIITGVTGMVGEAVLTEALNHPAIDKVLVIGRKPCGKVDPKLKEIIHSDFFNLTPVAAQLKGYDACLFCLGVSSVGMKEDRYFSLTYKLTMHMAEILSKQNPDLTFCYISGAGTDSTEKGRINWARVKGKTENDLMKLPFKKVYAFRPGFLYPLKDQKNVHGFNALYTVLYPVLRLLTPKFVCTMKELALAMINSAIIDYGKRILEVKDIIALSEMDPQK